MPLSRPPLDGPTASATATQHSLPIKLSKGDRPNHLPELLRPRNCHGIEASPNSKQPVRSELNTSQPTWVTQQVV